MTCRTRRRCWPVLLAAVVLLAPACNLQRADQATVSDDGAYGVGVALPDAPEPADQPTTESESQQPGPGDPARQQPSTPPPPPAQARPHDAAAEMPDPPGRLLATDMGMVGQNSRVYLRGDHPRLVIEMTVVEGREPSQSALDHIRGILQTVLDKPEGIEFRRSATLPAAKDRYTTQDLVDIERMHRGAWSDDRTATIHMLFLNGALDWEDGTSLGVAYTASSIAIMTDRIRAASTMLVGAPAIERSVILHEIGHLLGLVNLGYTSPRDHEDPDHPGHSRHRTSVMYWAVERNTVASIFTGGPPADFHADDRADLADLKAGRL